jgi:branched-chain amino acid aminotransferase
MGYEIVERPISRSELYLAEEIFLTGTAAEIIAITKIDGHTVGEGKEGLVTRGIRQKYEKVVCGKIPKYKEWLTPVW